MNLLSRRVFLKNSFLSSVILLTYGGELFGAIIPMQTIVVLYRDLFPSTELVPDMEYINPDKYLSKILLHSRVNKDDKTFIRDGIKWLNEESLSKYKSVYAQLSEKKRQKVLKDVVDTDWGESWLAVIMTYLMEAMLGDPIYGGNKGKIGWVWLNHEGGYPRPTEELL